MPVDSYPSTGAAAREAYRDHRIVRVVSEDPDGVEDGAIWYREDLGEFRAMEDGAVVTLDTTGV